MIVWQSDEMLADLFFFSGSKRALTIDSGGNTLSFVKGRPPFTQTLQSFSLGAGYLIETDEEISIPSFVGETGAIASTLNGAGTTALSGNGAIINLIGGAGAINLAGVGAISLLFNATLFDGTGSPALSGNGSITRLFGGSGTSTLSGLGSIATLLGGAGAIALAGSGEVASASQSQASQSIFANSDAPTSTDNHDQAYELGMKFSSDVAGKITAIRFYKDASETGIHTGRIWLNGSQIASVVFGNESAAGWQQQALATPLAIDPGQLYTVSVANNVYYVSTPGFFTSTRQVGNLIAPSSAGVFDLSPGTFPNASFNNSNYYRDIVFVPN